MHTCQEVVFAVLENLVVVGYTRRHQLGDAAFYNFLGKLWVFQLVADGHTLAGTHQLGQVGVEGVVRKTCQLHISSRSIGAPCKHDAQNVGSFDSIAAERFVEIAHSEQQQGIRIFRLDGIVLLHQRGFYYFGGGFFGQCFWIFNMCKNII